MSDDKKPESMPNQDLVVAAQEAVAVGAHDWAETLRAELLRRLCSADVAGLNAALGRAKENVQIWSHTAVCMQRHRDAWRRYTTKGGERPSDFLSNDEERAVIEAREAGAKRVAELEQELAGCRREHQRLADAAESFLAVYAPNSVGDMPQILAELTAQLLADVAGEPEEGDEAAPR